MASVSGVIGATGGAIAKMLTDHDVDGVSAEYYGRQIKRGKLLLSVDTRVAGVEREQALALLQQYGGHSTQVG